MPEHTEEEQKKQQQPSLPDIDFDKLKVTTPAASKATDKGLTAVLDITADTKRTIQPLLEEIDELVTTSREVGDSTVSNVEAKGINEVAILKQAQLAELEAQKNTRALFEEAGGAPMLLDLVTAQREATEDMLREQQQVADNLAHESDGIIDFIANRFDLFYNQRELNAATARLSNTNAAIQQLAATTEANAKVLNTVARKETEATLSLERENLLIDSKILADKARLDAIRTNADAYKEAIAAKGLQFENQWREFSAYQTQENQEQRRIEHNLQVERFRFQVATAMKEDQAAQLRMERLRQQIDFDTEANPTRLADLRLKFKEAQEDAQRKAIARENLAASWNIGAAILGLPERPQEEIVSDYILGGQLAEDVIEVASLGIAGNEVAGEDPVAVITNLSKFNKERIASEGDPVMKVYAEVIDDIEATYSAQGATRPTKQQLQTQTNAEVQKRADAYRADISYTDRSNPYAPPPFQALANMPQVQATPLFPLLEPLKLTETNPQQIMDISMEAIKKGDLSIDQVTRSITSIFKAAGTHNNAFNGLKRWAFPLQTDFNTRLKKFTFTSGIKTPVVDLTDETAVKQLITSNLSAPFEEGSILETFGIRGPSLFDLGGAVTGVVERSFEDAIENRRAE